MVAALRVSQPMAQALSAPTMVVAVQVPRIRAVPTEPQVLALLALLSCGSIFKMRDWVRIESGVIVELVTLANDKDPADLYHVGLLDGTISIFREITNVTPKPQARWLYDQPTDTYSAPPAPPPPLTVRQKIIKRLRADPILKAQVIDSFEARGITDKQQMLDALEAKFADVI